MSLRIVETLRSSGPAEAARLIESMRSFITNDGLINTMNLYDLNDKKNDAMLIRTLYAYNSVPGLKEQVAKWLRS